MSSVMIVPYENRLSKLVQEPGGLRVCDAIDQAQHNLESVRDECMHTVDERLAEIEALHAAAPKEPDEDAVERIYRAANDIHALAGVFGLAELGKAAFSLCELVDRLRVAHKWDGASVEVHLFALRLLRHPDEHADRAAILDGLLKVTNRVPKKTEED